MWITKILFKGGFRLSHHLKRLRKLLVDIWRRSHEYNIVSSSQPMLLKIGDVKTSNGK